MSERLTIDALKQLQKRCGLTDVHLASLDEEGFTIAHTDHERATINLEDCPIHEWLLGQDPDDPPAPPGLYEVIPYEPDTYSESLGYEPFELLPVKGAVARDLALMCELSEAES